MLKNNNLYSRLESLCTTSAGCIEVLFFLSFDVIRCKCVFLLHELKYKTVYRHIALCVWSVPTSRPVP